VPILFVALHPSLDVRLILLVIIAGALGSFIHAATSFSDFVGNARLKPTWTWWYVLRPFIGASLALIIYFVIRGGFVTGGAVGGSSADAASFINPFGIAALAGLAGMFTKQATDKLSEVFNTLFRAAEGHGDAKRGGKLEPLTVTGTNPNVGSTAGSQTVQVIGTGFVEKATVAFATSAATVTDVKPTMITVNTPPHVAGQVDVSVTNPDGQKFVLVKGYTYDDGEAPPQRSAGDTSGQATAIDASATQDALQRSADELTATAIAPAADQTTAASAAATSADSTSSDASDESAQPPPSISELEPATGVLAGQETVLIKGENFAADAVVTFGGEPAQRMPNIAPDPNAIQVVTPPATQPGPVPVVVTNPDGQSAESTFTYEA
jgi:hypothetical protein